MFKEITGAQALMKQGGVFKPAKLYEFKGALFAAAAGGYVRLYADGATSKDKLNFGELHYDGPLTRDRFNRLRTDSEGTAVADFTRINTKLLGVTDGKPD